MKHRIVSTCLVTCAVFLCRFQAQREVRSRSTAKRERVPADVSRDAAGTSATQRHVVESLRRAVGQRRMRRRSLFRQRFHGDNVTASECCWLFSNNNFRCSCHGFVKHERISPSIT